jgi:hypothetical protein
MSSAVLVKIKNVIADALKNLKPKVSVGLEYAKVDVDLSGLQALIADSNTLGLTVERCFTSRRLYATSLDKESFEFAIKSASEIREQLDKRADELSGRGGVHRSHLQLVMAWRASTNRLRQVLEERQAQSKVAFIKDDRDSSEALVRFRRDTLPIIGF